MSELESGKPSAQIAREHGIHPSLPPRWRDELAEYPETAFCGNVNRYNYQARIAELEWILEQLHAENEPLKKSLRHDTEEGSGGENKADSRRRYMITRESLSDGLQFSISQSCSALGVSRSGYWKWLKRRIGDAPEDSE